MYYDACIMYRDECSLQFTKPINKQSKQKKSNKNAKQFCVFVVRNIRAYGECLDTIERRRT